MLSVNETQWNQCFIVIIHNRHGDYEESKEEMFIHMPKRLSKWLALRQY